jgi:hypothetical protein
MIIHVMLHIQTWTNIIPTEYETKKNVKKWHESIISKSQTKFVEKLISTDQYLQLQKQLVPCCKFCQYCNAGRK